MFNTVLYKGTTSKRHSTKEITINEAGNPRQISWYWWWQREYEIRERIPMATVNWLISIFSTGGYYYLEPRTLQVLFCQCVLNDPDKEKRLTGLHQKQNFGQVALEFYLAEALLNLPEFGSEQTMKFESTYEHFNNVAAWIESSQARELISQCSDPSVNTFKIYSF